MSRFEARITIDAGENTKAVFDSIKTDGEYYPENPARTGLCNGKIDIQVGYDHLPHLRANINSTLRLAQAGHDSIESVKSKGRR